MIATERFPTVERWSWLPIPVLFGALVVLEALPLHQSFESWWVQSVLSFLFTTVASVVVAILMGRSFLVTGAPSLLCMAMGVLVWAVSGLLGPIVVPGDDNGIITTHNVLAWCAALCHLTGVVMAWQSTWRVRYPGLALAVACVEVVAVVGLVAVAVKADWLPLFFVQGQGGTPLRNLVLGSAVALYASAAVLLWRRVIPAGSRFTRWYALGLALIATGLFGVMIQTVHGGWVGWTGRAAQYLGGVYMIMAALASVREAGGWRLSLEETVRQSQQRIAEQARLLDLTGDAIFIRDADDRILYWNQGAVEVYGYSAEEALGQVTHELLRTATAEPLAAIRQTLRDTGRWQGELTHTAKNGARIVVLSRWVLDRADGDRAGRVLETNTDITARKAAEAHLRESQRFTQSIIEAAPTLTYVYDVDEASNVFISPQSVQMLGYTPEEIEALGSAVLSTLLHPDDAPRAAERFQQMLAIAADDIFELEYRMRRKDGAWVWLFSRDRVFRRDAHGKPTQILGVATDITTRKRAEAELREADRRKDEFLATLAHELRNPLAPIRNALSILQVARADPPTFDQTRDMMERQLNQMVRLIDDLLDVSRITRNKLELRKERVELASVIHHAVEACRPLIERANQKLTLTLPPEPVYVDGDPVRLAQVFGNLLTNACKYTEREGRIALVVERQGSEVMAKVKDSGVGIPPDMLPKVFEMFTQVERSLERSQGGLGIGLTLVQRLVELHGGTVTAHSEGLGQGSEFVVRLPILLDSPRSLQQHEFVAKTMPAPARRILVVDDNKDAATSLAMLLQLTGNDTQLAHDGVEAVERASAYKPDLILLDIGLPKMNGYDACRAIRAEPWGKDVVIVALTGWGQDEDRRKSQEAGFDDHLVKPVSHAALMKVLAAPGRQEGAIAERGRAHVRKGSGYY